MWSEHQKLSPLPLTEEQANRMLEESVKEVRRTVIGRRFIPLFGPLGPGVESVPLDTFKPDDMGEIDLEGRPDPTPIGAHEKETYVRIPLIYKDFVLHWRDVKWSKEHGAPLDVSNAIRAAHQVAHREDDFIFNGSKALGISGLLNWQGVKRVKGGKWTQAGVPLKDTYQAMEVLIGGNHHFPYALICSLKLYKTLLKAVTDSPVLEIEQVNKLCTDGVFYSPAIADNLAAVVSTGPQNFDIAVAEDLHIAYLGPADMNYRFRVYESLILRVRRPSSICVIETSV